MLWHEGADVEESKGLKLRNRWKARLRPDCKSAGRGEA